MNTRRTSGRVGVILVAMMIAGCSSGLTTSRIGANALNNQSKLNGLVTNVSKPHVVVAVLPKRPGASEFEVVATSMPLPADDEYYVVGYQGALFATRELQVDLNSDTTVQRVKLSSQSTAATDLESIATALDTAKADVKEIKEDQAARKKDPVAEANADLKEETINLMLKANRDAILAGKDLPFPDILK